MVKKLTLNCNFPSGSSPVNFYVGDPNADSHPISFQSKWLSEVYGGSVPEDLMKSMEELQKIAIKNRLNFEDLCEYVFDEVKKVNSINSEKQIKQKQKAYISSNDKVLNSPPETEEVGSTNSTSESRPDLKTNDKIDDGSQKE